MHGSAESNLHPLVSMSHPINEIDQSVTSEVVLQIRCMAMACMQLGGRPWRCSLSHSINEIDQGVATEVVLHIRCMAMAYTRLFLQLCPQISYLKSQKIIIRYPMYTSSAIM